MYSYCVFCVTARREDVALALRRRYDWRVLTPRIIQRKWIKGVAHEVAHDYLPGYLFIYTETAIENPYALRRQDYVIRCLGSPEAGYVLQGSDLAFAEMLYGCDGTIGILKAYQEGDRVKLVEGALGRFEGEIIRLERHKGRAQIRYEFDGAVYKTWVGYDMIEENVKFPEVKE